MAVGLMTAPHPGHAAPSSAFLTVWHFGHSKRGINQIPNFLVYPLVTDSGKPKAQRFGWASGTQALNLKRWTPWRSKPTLCQ